MICPTCGSDLPSGTVTFLFTDVEGSTQLLHELGAEAYDDALMQHRRALREACGGHGGVEVDTQGDAFFYAFPTAQGAVEAAREGQQALGAGPISVRMGLHTGTPHLGSEGYVGDDVHLGARIAASAHGGQVVLSPETCAFVDGDITDLGEHRLKDISEAVWIFQLGNGSFPPLKTISNTNLPRPASSFVGRDDELLEVLSRIEEGARLVTLTGTGGTGKTRLAIEAAAALVPEYKAGVFWVGLATLRDPGLVTETIAQTLGAKDGLAEHIGDREQLLLLDNLEQVIEAAPDLAELLTACPNLTLLVTSRELLRIQGEIEYSVPPLAEPEAVSLFCERSQLEPSDEIAELCRRLDDMPLAVELAAARTSVLTPEQILERLSQRLDLLKGGRGDADPRQQTLRTTIEWSYELLSPEGQQLFARLSVFAGGCTLDAAEEVCDAGLDTLQSLVEKSLVRFSDGRYWMLETIREYASERLETSGEAEEARERHTESFLALAEDAEQHLHGNDRHRVEQLEREHDNLRAALDRLEVAGDTERALRLAGASWRFWYLRSHYEEGRRRLERVLDSGPAPVTARGKALHGAAAMARNTGDVAAAKRFAEEALDLHRALGDDSGEAYSVFLLGTFADEQGDFAGARRLLEESVRLFGKLGDEHFALLALSNLAWVVSQLGDRDRARALHEENLAWARRLGNRRIEGISLAQLAVLACDEHVYGEAHSTLTEAIGIARELDDPYEVANDLCRFASLFARSSCHRQAVMLMARADALREEIGATFDSWALTMNEETLLLSRVHLGEHGVAAASEKGRTLTVDEAIELACSSP